MKKIILTPLLLLVLAAVGHQSTFAQRFAFVDTEFILSQMPEYTAAQKQVDVLADQWAKEIDAKRQELDKMMRTLQAEQVLLGEDMIARRNKDIQDKEKELNELQQKRFGFEGDLFKKRRDLIKPIQDKVYNAIQKIATERNIDAIFDKSNEAATILYGSPKYDRSEDIITAMGYTVKKRRQTAADTSPNTKNSPDNTPTKDNKNTKD